MEESVSNGKADEEASGSTAGGGKKRSRITIDSDSDSDDDDDKVALKKERKEEVNAGSKRDAAAKMHRKGKADDSDDDVTGQDDEEAEEEEAEEDEKEKEKEEKAIKKMASIFEKKPPTETKASWKQGELVPYSALAQTFAEIEATTKRLIILETLTNFFVKVIRLSPDDLLPCVYLCINRLCPDYEGLELGIGESLLIKSIAQSTGRDVARLKKDLEQKGDLGLVAIVSPTSGPEESD